MLAVEPLARMSSFHRLTSLYNTQRCLTVVVIALIEELRRAAGKPFLLGGGLNKRPEASS